MEVLVDSSMVGFIIGRKGRTIKTVQECTDTKIKSPNMGEPPIFVIKGRFKFAAELEYF